MAKIHWRKKNYLLKNHLNNFKKIWCNMYLCVKGIPGFINNPLFNSHEVIFLPASPKAKAGLGVQSLRPSVRPSICPSICPSVCPSIRPKILSSQLLWNYWSNYHETWYVDRTSYGVMHIGRKFWSPYLCWTYVHWNLENTYKWPCHCNSSETTDPFIMKLGM